MTNVIGCTTVLGGNVTTGVVDCMAVATDMATTTIEYGQSILSSSSELIQATLGSLYTGYGDVKFTLSWNTDVDLDLYVAEPNGEIIWYGNRVSVTGGQLDVDNTTGYGPENIFWPTVKAPTGTYTVWVEMYSGNKPTEFRVKPELPGEYQGVVFGNLSEDGQRADVGTYTVTNSGGKQVVTFNKSPIKTIASPTKGKYSKKSTNFDIHY